MKKFIFLTFFIFGFFSQDGYAATDAHLNAPESAAIQWKIQENDNKELAVKADQFGSTEANLYVVLKGIYQVKDGNLVYEKGLMIKKVSDQNPDFVNFTIKVYLEGPTTSVRLISVDALGLSSSIEVSVEYPEYSDMIENARKPRAHRLLIEPQLGLSSLGLSETLVQNFSQTSVDLNVGLTYALKKPWDASLKTHLSFLPISSNQSATQMNRVGISATGGYQTPWLNPPFSLALRAGFDYQTTFVTSNMFGYKDLFGLTLMPEAKYLLPQENTWLSLFLKYSAFISPDFSPFSSQEFSFGLSYHRTMFQKHPMFVSIGFSTLHLDFQKVLLIDTSYFSFGIGYKLNALFRPVDSFF